MFKDWDNPPNYVWVWGKYKKYDEVYCHSEEINQAEFEIPVTKYVRDDLVVPKWQPIESVPKDGESVLLVCMNAMPGFEKYLGYMSVDSWKDRYDKGFGQFHSVNWPATHWMPLPAVPKADECPK